MPNWEYIVTNLSIELNKMQKYTKFVDIDRIINRLEELTLESFEK